MEFKYFEATDRCFKCKKLIVSEHNQFLFGNSPDAIRLHEGTEWQPSPEAKKISMDNGPARVAYVWSGDHLLHLRGEPVVMVHEGHYEGMYEVCNAAYCEPVGAWIWLCQPAAPKEPVTEEWLLSISS